MKLRFTLDDEIGYFAPVTMDLLIIDSVCRMINNLEVSSNCRP